MVLWITFWRTYWESKKSFKKNPRKREEEKTQEDDPYLGPGLKTIGSNLPTIGLTKTFNHGLKFPPKYILLWAQIGSRSFLGI